EGRGERRRESVNGVASRSSSVIVSLPTVSAVGGGLSMLLAPVVWILTAIIAYFFAAKTWWFPPPISAHGIAYDEQFMRTLMVTGVIFVLAQFALGWVIFRF